MISYSIGEKLSLKWSTYMQQIDGDVCIKQILYYLFWKSISGTWSHFDIKEYETQAHISHSKTYSAQWANLLMISCFPRLHSLNYFNLTINNVVLWHNVAS